LFYSHILIRSFVFICCFLFASTFLNYFYVTHFCHFIH